MKEYDNIDILSEKEKRYLEHDELIISPLFLTIRIFVSVFLLIISSLMTPSAEGKMPFSSFFKNTKKRVKYTKYRKAVIKKLENRSSDNNEKILSKLNSEPFVFDEDTDEKIKEEQEIEKIYEKYLEEHEND